MDFSKIALVQGLQKRMDYLSDRQSLLAQNIANANTPGYTARDLEKVDFSKMVGHQSNKLKMMRTHEGHISGARSNINYRIQDTKKNFETSPDGNNVILEEQMSKLSANNGDYLQTTNLYRKMVDMFTMAAGNRQ